MVNNLFINCKNIFNANWVNFFSKTVLVTVYLNWIIACEFKNDCQYTIMLNKISGEPK